MLLPRWPFIVVLFLLGANGFLHPKLEGTAAGLRNAPANYYDEAVVGTEKHEHAGTVEDTPADSSFRSFTRSKFPFFTAPRAPDEVCIARVGDFSDAELNAVFTLPARPKNESFLDPMTTNRMLAAT